MSSLVAARHNNPRNGPEPTVSGTFVVMLSLTVILILYTLFFLFSSVLNHYVIVISPAVS